MFFLMDTPNQKQFENLARRYDRMDVPSVQALVKLLRTGSDLLTGFEKMLGTYGLSQGRFLILVILNRTPEKPLTPSGLAEKLGVTRATMTGLVTGLEKDQLITRQTDSVDKRKIHIRLTAKGLHRLESILPDYYNRINGLMQGLNLKEKTTSISLLKIVDTGLPSLTGGKMNPQKNGVEISFYTPVHGDQVIDLILPIQQKEFNIPITAGDCKGIMGGALEWARLKNISEIFLGTTEKFLAAHKFYEKNGFVPIDKDGLPGSFPIMSVDTKFYVYKV